MDDRQRKYLGFVQINLNLIYVFTITPAPSLGHAGWLARPHSDGAHRHME
jgi:hypothetical protein